MGDTAPRSLCLGGELLIPLRGAAVLFVYQTWISDKLKPAQTHSISTHSKTSRLTILASKTATELWRSALHWSATMDQSQTASDRHLMRARKRQGFGWKRWSREWIYNVLGLFNDYRVRRSASLPKVAPAR